MPSVGDEEAELVSNVLKLSRIVRSVTARAGESLNLSHQAVLFTVHRNGPIRASELAQQLRVGTSAMSRQLAELENAGLITREQDDADGRAALVALSEEGKAYLSALRRRRAERMKATLQNFSATELREINSNLDKLNAHLSAALDIPTAALKTVESRKPAENPTGDAPL